MCQTSTNIQNLAQWPRKSSRIWIHSSTGDQFIRSYSKLISISNHLRTPSSDSARFSMSRTLCMKLLITRETLFLFTTTFLKYCSNSSSFFLTSYLIVSRACLFAFSKLIVSDIIILSSINSLLFIIVLNIILSSKV